MKFKKTIELIERKSKEDWPISGLNLIRFLKGGSNKCTLTPDAISHYFKNENIDIWINLLDKGTIYYQLDNSSLVIFEQIENKLNEKISKY